MRRIDYDTEQHQDYARGRALSEQQMQAWIPSAGTREDMLERLRLRTHSFCGQLSPEELETGFRSLEQAVAADPGAPAPVFPQPLLTLERP